MPEFVPYSEEKEVCAKKKKTFDIMTMEKGEQST